MNDDRARHRQLVIAARSGDRAAFAQLYTVFAPIVHAVLLSRLSPADADDGVQDVFARALDRLEQLRDPDAFPAWIMQSAHRHAMQHYRRRAVERAHETTLRSCSNRPDDSSFPADREQLLAAVRALPSGHAEILLMRFVQGLSGPEIADRTGMSHDAARNKLMRAIAQLRERLSPRESSS
ncbi:MAG: sigma-70 family RNA polymerase sigma factor [Planctomycetota bacterium]